MEKSILEMVGGEKHIKPHYDIKAESISCYPAAAEPRENLIAALKKENAELKAIVTHLITQPLDDEIMFCEGLSRLYTSGLSKKQVALVEQFIK